MADIINRFRRRKVTPQSSSSSTEPVYVDEKNISIPSNNEISGPGPVIESLESKTSQSRDPEIAIDPIAEDEESDIEEDLKDIPKEVRNIVSFEDDQNLPTITFRYFFLTFLFIVPGAFLYQMVSSNPESKRKAPVLTTYIGSISYNCFTLLQLLRSDRLSLCWPMAGEDPTCMENQNSLH
jgi:hypothetical protein